MSTSPRRLSRLRWLCRRGMRELDVPLERFLIKHADELEQGEWPELETLLQIEDDVFWDWLQNPDHPAAAEYSALLVSIRAGK